MEVPAGFSEKDGVYTADGLTISAQEMHATSEKLAVSVDTLLRAQGQADLVTRASLPRAELVIPKAAGLPLLAFMRHDDGTVQRLELRMPSDACLPLVRAMLATLLPGPRRYLSWPGPHAAAMSPDGSVVVVTTPAEAAVIATRGTGSIRLLRPLESNPPQAQIEITTRPTWRNRQTQHDPATETQSHAFGTRITWVRWHESGREWEEAMLPYPQLKGRPLMIHIEASAASEADLAVMTMVLESAVLSRRQ